MFETFSKRKKRATDVQEVYQTMELPAPLRVQIVHWWRDTIGEYKENAHGYYPYVPTINGWWEQIHAYIIREHGVFYLQTSNANPFEDWANFILNGPTERCLDLIELTARWVERVCCKVDFPKLKGDEAISELNHRFKENGVGYEYIDGELIEITSEFIHSEVVRPAIALLQRQGFDGAGQEFLRAHEHFRKGRYKESVTDALKAFESTMKCIAAQRKWQVEPTATASRLVEALFTKGLISTELQSEFGAVKSLLTTGLPTVRNRQSGHGQGPEVIEMPEHVAAFALHMAAANIVFIVSAHDAKK